jgi:alpha-tubulin suppressor-like RCC1 family protein
VIAHPNSIVSVYAGHSHSAFIDSAKDAYFFGFNSDYRLMIGDEKTVVTPKRVTIRDVVSASLGVSHSALITVGGSLYCGGVGTYG